MSSRAIQGNNGPLQNNEYPDNVIVSPAMYDIEEAATSNDHPKHKRPFLSHAFIIMLMILLLGIIVALIIVLVSNNNGSSSYDGSSSDQAITMPPTKDDKTTRPTTTFPSTDMPTTVQPDTDPPSSSKPSTPETDTPTQSKTDPPTTEPTTTSPSTDTPTTVQPDTDPPSTSEPSTPETDTPTRSKTDPPTTEPTTTSPSTDTPTTVQPDTDPPSTSEPSTPETDTPTQSNTDPPTSDVVEKVKAFLILHASFDFGAAFDDTSSPQYAALLWLAADSNNDLRQYSDERLILRYVLATLYFSTNGDNWTSRENWLSHDHECDWSQQIQCFGDDLKILLTRNNLEGTIPDEIGLLSNNLKEIYLDRNVLHGNIPSSLKMLAKLERFLVCINDLTGAIPTELGSLTKLSVLDLGNNRLNGDIPSELGKLTSVDTLRLEKNLLESTIPTELGMIEELRFLNLTDNELFGSIPNELAELKKLKRLFLRGNHFKGDIPYEICMLPDIEKVVLECSHHCQCCVSCAPGEFTCIDDPPFTAIGSIDIGPHNLDGSSEKCGPHCYSVVQGGYSGKYVQDDFSDVYHFTYQSLHSKKFRFTAEVCGQGCNADDCGNIGLMVRESLDQDSKAVFANHQPRLYAGMISRSRRGGLKTIDSQIFQIDHECIWINLIRQGSTFTFSCDGYSGYAEGKCEYQELDGKCDGYDSLGEVQINMSRNVFVGLAVSGHRPIPGFGLDGHNVAKFHYIELENRESELENPESDLKQFLKDASPWDGGASLDDQNSPQFQAFQWMLDDPDLDSTSDTRKLQRYALATLWYSTSGASWKRTNWAILEYNFMSYSLNECSWLRDISCTNGLLRTLKLGLFDPDGNLPLEIGLLSPELRELSIRDSSLTGRIPTTIGILTKLENLDLSFNDLTQNIPTQIGLLTNLKVLSLGRNNLDGTMPTQLGTMTSLQTIGLEQNSISGPIPPHLGRMKELRHVHLDDNNLSGVVPTEIAKLEKLIKLTIQKNELEGNMPTDICAINSLELVLVDCDEVLFCSCCTLCETIDQCFEVSSRGDVCQVRMEDNFNNLDVVIEVRSYGNHSFLVIDDVEHVEEQWAVPIVLNDAGDLSIAAGVPDVTCDGILKDRTMKDDSQLTFTEIPDHPCTQFGKNIIYFMIMEWFYFGR